MIFVIFNLAILFILICYCIISGARKNFNLFSPWFFPLGYYGIYYLLPYLGHILILNRTIRGLGNYLHLLAIISFLISAAISMNVFQRKYNSLKMKSYLRLKFHKIPVLFFFLLGMMLLVLYGFVSGVTLTLLSGGNIEELRRTAEVGKGFLKEPGVFFFIYGLLWLIGTSLKLPIASKTMVLEKKSKRRIFLIILLLAGCILIFITTGHKAQTLLPFILAIGIYSKKRYVSPVKMVAVGLIVLLVVGVLTFLRGDISDLPKAIIQRGFLYHFYIFEANYIPIINMVDNGTMELQYGREYLQNATFIIPRFIYPEKPVSFDYFLKEQLHRTFAGGGLPATPVGSLYLNFGFWGVILGMALLGGVYGYIYKIYIESSQIEIIILSLYVLYYLLNPSLLLSQLELILIFIIILYGINKITYTVALENYHRRLALSSLNSNVK